MQTMAPVLDPIAVERSLVFVVSMVVLMVAHQLGDHVLQTDHQAVTKAGPGWPAVRAMTGHLCTYHAVAAILLFGVFALLGLPLTSTGTVAGLAFSAFTHGFLDRRWPVRAILRAARSPRFAETTTPICGLYAADQSLHLGALLVSAVLVATL